MYRIRILTPWYVVQAWNVKPRSASNRWTPSAEFVESALIFTYGATNIFLEHLGRWGGEWSFEDLEHISITVLFIGGGLVSNRPPPGSLIALLGTRYCTIIGGANRL